MLESSREVKIEHFNNLIAVAFADGVLDDEEKNFLYDKADELDLPEEDVRHAIENADQLVFMVPQNMEDREDQLADIVYMAMIDGEIHEKEYNLCLSIANRLDFNREDLNDVIDLTKKLWKK